MASKPPQGVSMDEKSSPTTSGPDSDVASVEEDLPNDLSDEGSFYMYRKSKAAGSHYSKVESESFCL